ncbi:MAG: hypothetical protein IJV36_05975, partial [Prevotella sp.]|nr:hypothetical protein [Prevotella sp.]
FFCLLRVVFLLLLQRAWLVEDRFSAVCFAGPAVALLSLVCLSWLGLKCFVVSLCLFEDWVCGLVLINTFRLSFG